MENLKLQAYRYLETLREELFVLGKQLFEHPELGFKENLTKSILWDKFSKLSNLNLRDSLAITGFSASLKNDNSYRTIGLLAEMDAVYQPHHFCAAKDGASHCCGHDSQMVIMYSVLKTFHDLGVQLPVNLELIFTPAEEFLDLDYRLQLQNNGMIKALSGKQEMLANGDFNHLDIVISSHSLGGNPDLDFDLGTNLAGFIIKRAKFIGKSSHAGAAPHLGINALNAANLAMSAIAYIRETFPNEDYIRVSPIIKNSNLTSSVVPAEVELEMYVRAASSEAIESTVTKIDNCLRGAALAIGCSIEITNIMGYLPLRQHPELSNIAVNVANQLTTKDRILNTCGVVAASGDIGDLSLLKPTVQIGYGGYRGNIHGVDFAIDRPEVLYISTAKLVIGMICDLIENDNLKLEQICNDFVALSMDDYQQLILRLSNAS